MITRGVRNDALVMGRTRCGRPDRPRGVLLVDQHSDDYSARCPGTSRRAATCCSGVSPRAPARRSDCNSSTPARRSGASPRAATCCSGVSPRAPAHRSGWGSSAPARRSGASSSAATCRPGTSPGAAACRSGCNSSGPARNKGGEASCRIGTSANEKAKTELASLKSGFSAKDLIAALNDSVTNFPSGSAEVPATTAALLQSAADDLKQLPAGHVLEIAGYTDNTGNPAKNITLSQRRADAIRDTLIKDGVNPDTLTAKGYGSADPIASNDIPEGRLRNRRIEYHILKTP